MLIVSGVTKALPGGRVLFENLELQVAPGECVAIMGESGVGKSTLLNLIAGLDQASSGQIRIDGIELGALDDDARTLMRRERIGFVFQAFHLLAHLNLEQNVALILLLNGVNRNAALSRAQAGLEEVGLGARAADFPHQLSGGELQRVAIARALAHRPRLLLADEPTGNLDPGNAERVLSLMQELTKKTGAALLLVTHSDAAARIADRRLELTTRGFIER